MRVVLVGSGNVASHMARAFKASGHTVLQVWSATFEHAAVLAEAVDAEPIHGLSDISEEADLIMISVKDDAISHLVSQLVSNAIVVHTSGATDIAALSHFKRHGVLYPLQTFSKSKALDFTRVPLCIEANNEETLTLLKDLSESLSSAVYSVDSAKRKILHLAATFACNFVNQLYALSNDLLAQHHLDFDLLRPLIAETAEKVQYILPIEAQTGPAVRNDKKTLQAHLELLESQPELKNIYQTLSDSIKKSHQ
ncbi:MAG: Rossmann-like and DUF2520 domain-containing protein [Pedobacter sp.]